MSEHCIWCGAEVEAGDGYRAYEAAGGRRAVFCRLEHVVPWAIRGAYWEAGESGDAADGLDECAWCRARLGELHIALVRHRGEARIADGLCGVEHLLEWAKAGGRYRL